MRTAILLASTLIAAQAFAFSGSEHRDLSNLALQAALLAAPDGRCAAAAKELLPSNSEDPDTFGDVTRAVDWFSKPKRLGDLKSTTDGEPGWSQASLWRAIRRRKWNPYYHYLALHRNGSHFQRGALDSYASLHAEAVQLAGEAGGCEKALYKEAIALHFLEDIFSAGHLVTPRAGFHDVVAGALHDQYNDKGVLAKVTVGREDLRELVQKGIRLCVVTCFDDNAIAAFSNAKNDANLEFLGDGHLSAKPEQALAIMIVSSRSIAEVIAPSESRSRVSVCFVPRSALSGLNINQPKDHTFEGPAAGVGISDSGGHQSVLDTCDESNLITVHVDDKDENLQLGIFNVSAVRLTAALGKSTKSDDQRRVLDLSFIVGAEPPNGSVRKRDKDGHITDEKFDNPASTNIAFNVSFAQGEHYRAIGAQIEASFQMWRRAVAGSIKIGPRRYSTEEHGAFWRYLEFGGKVVVGVEIFNVVLLIDRTRRVRGDGTISPETFIMPGFEFSVSQSWVRKAGKSVLHLFR
jgi:hypothetical protein